MAREFSLGYKKPNWHALEVGVGRTLSDAAIRKYIREGKYPGFVAPRRKTVSASVKSDRKVRNLVEEYATL